MEARRHGARGMEAASRLADVPGGHILQLIAVCYWNEPKG